MANIVSVASQKGGVGKTTTALNLAYSLSRFGERTLVLDADPQGSLAAAANLRKRTSRGLVDLLRNEASIDEVVVATRDGAMAMASLGAASADDVIAIEEWARTGKLAEVIRAIAGPYVNTVIDAPSGIGRLVETLLEVSHSVVVPVQPRNLTLKTLPAFLRAVQHVRRRNRRRPQRLIGALARWPSGPIHSTAPTRSSSHGTAIGSASGAGASW